MNSDKVKGSIDDAAGRAQRQTGEWTGDKRSQVEGAARQIKGKAEKAVGNVRDALHNAGKDRDADGNRDIDHDRERDTSHERK